MARIRSFSPGQQDVKWHPSEVDCFHQVISSPSGDTTFLHLSTFGSESRQSEPKSSQSLQFDRQRALELVSVIARAFPTAPTGSAHVHGKTVLRGWIIEALEALGGAGKLLEVCREVWRRHQADLEAAGDLLYTWQYDIRWAATTLRHDSVLIPADEQVEGRWQLASTAG